MERGSGRGGGAIITSRKPGEQSILLMKHLQLQVHGEEWGGGGG